MLARACVRVPERVGVCVRTRACNLANPARNAYAPYCDVMWPLWLHYIFRHYLINDAIFGKKSLNIKYMFQFSLQLLCKISPILRRIKRDIVKNVETVRLKYPSFLSDFNEI
jgi:hypothetical protein